MPGTEGYKDVLDRFIETTEAVPFDVLHWALLGVLRPPPARVLDVGAGIGRDAAVLAERRYRVVAVEPLVAYRVARQQRYEGAGITWVDDALRDLASFRAGPQFDLVLASGDWHHLNATEQATALKRVAMLMHPGGVVMLSLRHGPAGAGRHVFPTSGARMLRVAQACCLTPNPEASLRLVLNFEAGFGCERMQRGCPIRVTTCEGIHV
ncbi:MAG: class I SAM-dependent methyltransferase [Bacteroidota bacterium]